MSRHRSARGLVAVWLGLAGLGIAAQADEKPAGELWQQTVTVEMTGMSMPPHTTEVCVPPGRAAEALSRPQGPGLEGPCTLAEGRQVGNRFTARFSCGGQQPSHGTLESVVEGEHARGTISVVTQGRQMTLRTESHKIGTACSPGPVPGAS